ncbi:MAG: hypothetical protein K6G07_08725 [Lachnospiraceae bacterium]|nr:hypothetical protein [Lachnospiraceae bacterium]
MKQKRSEAANNNYLVLICMIIIESVIFLAYGLEVVKGTRTITYFLQTAATIVVPLIVLSIMYRAKPDNRWFRTAVIAGYAIMYGFVLFTTTNVLTFVYVMPMMMILSVYNSVSVSMGATIGATIMNIISVVYQIKTVPDYNTATGEIQVLIIIFVGAYAIVANRAEDRSNKIKMDVIEEEKIHTDNLLQTIVSLSDDIADGIFRVQNEMDALGESVQHTLTAMDEVSTGSTDTAETVQGQLAQTETIQARVSEVEAAAGAISDNVQEAKSAITDGNRNMQELIHQVQISEASGKQVVEELHQLEENTNQMHSIVEMINEVADQTSLLALNASIEAARAGEAGRGFAVVATEIGGLASQTQSATGNITGLIDSIVNSLKAVVDAVENLVEANDRQAEDAQAAVAGFELIEKKTVSINESSDQLNRIVQLLAAANSEIVESIQNISAITEEVSAHAAETYTISEKNNAVVQNVTGIVDMLSEKAQDLKNAQ